MNIWRKFLTDYRWRYVLSFALGLFFSILTSDIPFIADRLKGLVIATHYNDLLTQLTLWHLNVFCIPAILIDNQIVVGLSKFYFDYGCLGIRHLTLFAFFILFYFGSLKHKLAYILLGFLILTFANVSRATLIGIAIYINPLWFDFVHEYGSMIFLYGTIFLLWIVWAKRVNSD
mgnify:CR=1 FL=1